MERSKASLSTHKVTHAYFTAECLENKLRKPRPRRMQREGHGIAPDGDSRPRVQQNAPGLVTRGH